MIILCKLTFIDSDDRKNAFCFHANFSTLMTEDMHVKV